MILVNFFSFSSSSFPDETSSLADLVLPTHTPLERWGDSVPIAGLHGLMQPVMRPIFNTRHFGDVLLDSARALGRDVSAELPRRGEFLDFLQDRWEELQESINARETEEEEADPQEDFDDFWANAQRRGGFFGVVETDAVRLNPTLLSNTLELEPTSSDRALDLIVYPSLHYYDGRGANRPWLQEIPDPLMKTTWASWVEASSQTAQSMNAQEGQLVRLTTDHGTVENGGVHSNETLVLNDASVDYGCVSNGDVVADDGRIIIVKMDNGAVLDISAFPDLDEVDVAAQNATVPHTAS